MKPALLLLTSLALCQCVPWYTRDAGPGLYAFPLDITTEPAGNHRLVWSWNE